MGVAKDGQIARPSGPRVRLFSGSISQCWMHRNELDADFDLPIRSSISQPPRQRAQRDAINDLRPRAQVPRRETNVRSATLLQFLPSPVELTPFLQPPRRSIAPER